MIRDDAALVGGRGGVLWDHWLLIVLTTVLGAIAAAVLAFITTPYYRAEVVVTPVRSSMTGGGGAAALASQLGGLAGLNLGGGGETQTAEAILESRHLIEEFIARNGLLADFGRPAQKPPTLWYAVKDFKENVLFIRNDTRKSTTTIAIEWRDPPVAARWANDFVALANDLVRTRALNESKRNISYLTEQLAKATDVELRRVMYDIIESETKTLMLASGRVEYAFQVVDPAVPPEVRVRPRRALMVLAGCALGLLIGVFSSLVLDQAQRRREVAAGAVNRAG